MAGVFASASRRAGARGAMVSETYTYVSDKLLKRIQPKASRQICSINELCNY